MNTFIGSMFTNRMTVLPMFSDPLYSWLNLSAAVVTVGVFALLDFSGVLSASRSSRAALTLIALRTPRGNGATADRWKHASPLWRSPSNTMCVSGQLATPDRKPLTYLVSNTENCSTNFIWAIEFIRIRAS
jgi:hypothetical protein